MNVEFTIHADYAILIAGAARADCRGQSKRRRVQQQGVGSPVISVLPPGMSTAVKTQFSQWTAGNDRYRGSGGYSDGFGSGTNAYARRRRRRESKPKPSMPVPSKMNPPGSGVKMAGMVPVMKSLAQVAEPKSKSVSPPISAE